MCIIDTLSTAYNEQLSIKVQHIKGSHSYKHSHVDQIPIITVRFVKYSLVHFGVLVRSSFSTDPTNPAEKAMGK